MPLAQSEGLAIFYQGYTCGTVFEYSRPAGLEPGFGFVHVSRDVFKLLDVQESIPGLDALMATTRDKSAKPSSGFLSSGDLVIRETFDAETYTATINQVMLSERACEVPFWTEDGGDIVRVELTDIRALWGSRGVLFGWINVPKPGPSAPAPTSGGTQDRAIATPAAPSSPNAFVPGSLRNGKPWLVVEVLREKILPALPGTPTLKRFPDSLKNEQARTAMWNPALPKEALAEVLKDHGLVVTLNLDASLSFWKEGEGALQDANGKAIPLGDPKTGKGIDKRVSNARSVLGFHYVPSSVLVFGPPVVQNVRIDNLEPVGEIGGQLLPFNDFVKACGIADPWRFVFLSDGDQQLVDGVSDEGIAAFRLCGFKWFRIPGLMKAKPENADKLPIGPRGVVDSLGQFLPERVWCEGHDLVNNAKFLFDNVEREATTTSAKSQIAAARKLEALLNFDAKAFKVVVNVPFAELSTGVSLDLERGIVKFGRFIGHVNPPGNGGQVSAKDAALGGVSPTTASLVRPVSTGSSPSAGPRVMIEYGYTLKPDQNDSPKVDHRYFSLWVRTAQGAISKVDDANAVAAAAIKQLPLVQPGLTPLSVYRPEFQQVNDVGGQTNKAALDALAKRIASDIMSKPTRTAGAVVQFHRPTPVAPTGKITNVLWSATGEGIPMMRVTIGTYAPLAPKPDVLFKTRAFGEQSATSDCVFMPPGLSS
jgi:hypothetical protein